MPPAADAVPAPVRLVHPSGRSALVVRLLLTAIVAVATVAAALAPAERSVDELLTALARGEVRTLTIDRPTGEALGSFPVRWTGAGRPGKASYEVDTMGGAQSVDQGREILAAAAASPRRVDVRTTDRMPPTGFGWAPSLVVLGAFLGAFLLLVAGPEPRLATRWAWFWLCLAAWPVWLAFLVLEPTGLWDRRVLIAPTRRLTGGWAFLIGLFAGPALLSAVTGS